MEIGPPAQQHFFGSFYRVLFLSVAWLKWTRGPKCHISCTWVQCATFLRNRPEQPSCFPISTKNTNLVEDVEISLPVKFHWILFNRFRREVENVSAHQRPLRSSCFSDRPEEKTNLVEDIEILFPVKFCWIPFRSFRGEVENVPANQRPGSHLVFPIGPKNTNFVEDVDILLPVKFLWIPFSRFRGEVENVSAN